MNDTPIITESVEMPPLNAGTIQREWCSKCGGTGHQPGCNCHDGLSFVMGCCQKCGGEGLVSTQPEKEFVIVTR